MSRQAVEPSAAVPEDRSFDAFRAALAERDPALAAVTFDTPLAYASGDRIRRALRYGAVWDLLPTLEERALLSITTFGEAAGWWEELGGRHGEGASQPSRDRTQTARVRLRPLRDGDAPLIHEQAAHPRDSYRWLFKGIVPPPTAILDVLRRDAPLLLIVERVDTAEPVCLCMAYDLSLGDRRAHFAVMGLRAQTPGGGSVGEAFEGLYLFLDHIFRLWSLDRVFASIPGYNWPQFAAGEGSEFEVVARIPEYDRFDNRWWDRVAIVIDAARWARIVATWDAFLLGTSPTNTPSIPPNPMEQHT